MAQSVPRPGPTLQLRALNWLARDLGKGLQRIYRTFGPVSDIGYGARSFGPTGRGGSRLIYALGAEANESVLSTKAASFAWGPAMRPLEAIDGPTAVLLSDGDEHRRRRRLVQPAFAKREIDGRVGLIVTELDAQLDRWHAGDRIDAHAQVRSAVRRIVVRSLFGTAMAGEADRFGELLAPMLDYVQRPPYLRFDVDLRVNAFGRAVRARQRADAIIRAEIARRRVSGVTAGDEATDVLTRLLAGVDGEQLDDAELCDQVRSLVAAGYDTTSGAAAWIVVELGRNPDVLEAVRDQIVDVLGDAPPTIDGLRRLPLVDGVVREVLRLWPAGRVAPRMTTEAVEVCGYEIPPGRLVVYSPYVTGRMDEYWDEPDRFEPARWTRGDRPVPPSVDVPFGGGARRCLGFALATLELQVFVVRLVQRVAWRLERNAFTYGGMVSSAPSGGVPITIIPRRTSAFDDE